MAPEVAPLLLATLGLPAVVSAVGGIAYWLVKWQQPSVNQQIQQGNADIWAAEQEWLQKQHDDELPVRASV